MNKTTIDYVKARVNEVVQCTNGSISTRMNKKRKNTGLTLTRKIAQIRSGRAILKPDWEIGGIQSSYKSGIEFLEEFYDFEITEGQKKKMDFNKRLEQAIEDMHTQVELEGKRLVDKAVLGIIEVKELPGELNKLANMLNTTAPTDKAAVQDN